MCKVSVIVTVYNTEKYVEECIISLINQTYKNIEVILIDGGSTDKTPEICHEYEKEYENIRVVHKENEGVSAARNRGIEEATGDYILFVDGDDWIENNTIETLVWLEEENESDIAFIIKAGNEHSTGEVLIGDGKKMILHILEISAGEVWGKLFKKQIFEDVKFPEGKLHEDLYVMPTIFLKCKKIVAYHKGLYDLSNFVQATSEYTPYTAPSSVASPWATLPVSSSIFTAVNFTFLYLSLRTGLYASL